MGELAEALDPNTKPERLRELFVSYGSSVLENPALPLVLLENPGWVYKLDIDSMSKLLLAPELPEFFVRSLIGHPMANIAKVASMHVVLGEEVGSWEPLLRNLATLGYSQSVRLTLEEHGLIPVWLEPYLPIVKPDKDLNKRHFDGGRLEVAETLLQEVSKHPGFFAWFCCLLVTTKGSRLASAARSVSWFTRLGAVLHEKSKPGALKRLSSDSNRYIRFAAKARLCDTAWVFPPAVGRGG